MYTSTYVPVYWYCTSTKLHGFYTGLQSPVQNLQFAWLTYHTNKSSLTLVPTKHSHSDYWYQSKYKENVLLYLLLDTKWIDVTIGDDPSEEPIWVISSHLQYEIGGEKKRGNGDAQEREKGER